MFIRENINEKDISILKKSYDLKRVEFFKNVIYKTRIKETEYYSLPFFNENKELTNARIINLKFDKKIGAEELAFWSNTINFKGNYQLIFISDHPLSLIKYFSNNFNKYKNKSILFIVPSVFNNEAILKIKENYRGLEIITVFDNNILKEQLRILTSSVFAGNPITFKFDLGKYIISDSNKTVRTPEIKYSELQLIFKLASKVRHKENIM